MEDNKTTGISLPENESEHSTSLDSGETPKLQIGPPRNVREWLLLMEACPSVLQTMGSNPLRIARYQTALVRWKESGYPDPELSLEPDLVQHIRQVLDSCNEQAKVRVVLNSAHKFSIPEDDLNRILKIIDSGLDAITLSVGTAREVSSSHLELEKLGLNIAKLVFQSINSLGVGHNS